MDIIGSNQESETLRTTQELESSGATSRDRLDKIEALLLRIDEKIDNMFIEDDFITPQKAAELLKIKVNTIYRHVNSGKLTSYGSGNSIRIRKSDLLKPNKTQ